MESWRPDGPRREEPESAYDLLQRGQALLEPRHHAQAAIVLERADRLEPVKARSSRRSGGRTSTPARPSAHAARSRRCSRSTRLAVRALRAGSEPQAARPASEAGTHLRLAVALSPETTLYRDALDRLG